MPDPIDALVQQWKHDPSAAKTVALCEALRGSPRRPLVQEVGEFAAQRHARDVTVLVSVARMYVESQRLADAQTVLLTAGKHAPRDARVYRWLGEVLLRRGDAARASKVLERALQFGPREPEAQIWLERARTYEPMQASAGDGAVATEVADATTARARIPSSISLETPTRVAAPARGSSSAPAPARAPVPPAWTSRSPQAPPPPVFSRGPIAPPRFSPPPPPPDLFGAAGSVSASSAPAMRRPPPPALVPTAPPIPGRLRESFRAEVRGPKRGTNGHGTAQLATAPELTVPAGANAPAVPYPRDVLEALTLSGVYEPNPAWGAAAASWDRARPAPKRKGAVTLIVGMVLFLAGSAGTYVLYQHKRAADHLRSEAILANVEAELNAGRPDALGDEERELGKAFQLESRSPRGALDWTRERAMVGLLKSGADVAFEDAMARDKEVGVAEESFAFARVASFLLQGDTAGAAGMLPRWDGPAAADPWYQLVTGAALERAGDARARERYAAAAKLAPALLVAQLALARVTALEGDTEAAMRMANALRAQRPDRAEPVALVALAWGRDPERDTAKVPSEVADLAKRAGELPVSLQFVPHAIAAIQAIDRHAIDEARAEIQRGLAIAESPDAAVWLGTIALPLGDETLARKAALDALQLSAVYEPARALAARVALHAGRLDEALKATEDLDPGSGDVAVVRAAAAYEREDEDGVARALEAVRPEDRRLPSVIALARGEGALSGKVPIDSAKALSLSDDDTPWADLMSMDQMLDVGDLATADRIAAAWGKESESAPLRALRLARLARYEGRLEAAEALSQVALDHATVTPRLLRERTFDLVARGRVGEVASLLSRYPLVLGPLATWLAAYASATAGNVDAPKGKTATLDPPPDEAALGARVVAATAFGAMKDHKRGVAYLHEVLSSGIQNPDLVNAALSLGMRRVEHGKRRPPTYE